MCEVWAIKDTFHQYLKEERIVKSDDPCFKGDIREFFHWINQHGGNYDDCYRIVQEWKVITTASGEEFKGTE